MRPHVAVITAIGLAHTSYVRDVEATARYKARIFRGLEPGGVAVINRDLAAFPLLAELAKEYGYQYGTDWIALGLQVSRLMRVRFGIVSLPPRLKRGNWIELKEAEISELLEWAGSAPEAADEDVSDEAPPPSAGRQNRHRPRSRAR